MKSVKVDSTDLDHALKVTRTTVGSSSDISSHYVFRSRGGSLEVLSYDGRTFSSSIVGHTKVDEDVSFTVEARRIHVLLDSVGANQPLDISFSDSEVTVRTSRGKVTFSSLDPSVFPYWDDVLSGATLTAKILSDRLHAAFSHARQFISDQESKEPHLCVAEFRDGVLLSTDKLALSLVKIPGMEGSKLRVYVKDIPNILSFLAAARGDNVEILESDRASFIRRGDGAIFGETVFAHKFPNISMDWDFEDDQTWDVSQEELLDGIKFLQSGARTDEPRVRFQRSGTEINLSMTSVSGKPLPLSIPLGELNQKKGGVTEMPQFAVSDGHITKMLNGNRNVKIRLGVTKKDPGGWVRVIDGRGTDTYQTVVVWLKDA